MKPKLALVLAVVASLALSACASKLDAKATADNAANVKALVATVDTLHVKAKDADSLRKVDAEFGQSAQRLADAMAEAAK